MGAHAELIKRVTLAIEDPELPRLTPGLTTRISLQVGPEKSSLAVGGGIVALDGADENADVILSAPERAWEKVMQVPPPATYHSFTAFQLANPEFTLSGSPVAIAQARPALERLFEIVVASPPLVAPKVDRNIEQVTGRYKRVEVGGVEHDIFYEEAGAGTPILFLHTAGADGRQFLPQLSDTGFARTNRLISVDLPFHGRSMPPLTWDGSPYQLTTELYLTWCTAMLDQLVGDRAIVVGGSMGAAMCMVLAAERPERLMGVIAVEPPLKSKGRRNPFQHNVNVHGSLHNSAYVRGIMSPLSPQAERRRASWIYSQGAPGVYPGDLSFYSDEFDGAVVGPKIDAKRTPTVLLSGTYDYSATPADGAALAALIPGSRHVVMEGLGHFPMCENPDYFRSFLQDAIRFVEDNG